MLSGEPPYQSITLGPRTGGAPTPVIQDLDSFRLDVPKELELLIYRALERDRDLRIQELEDLRYELEQILQSVKNPPTDQRIRTNRPHSHPRLDASATRPAMTLPMSSAPFVGRETEMTEILALMMDPACRLLTLVGPGGIGKSRLAVEAAAEIEESFGDGLSFVQLTPVSSPAFIPFAIGSTLGLVFSDSREPRQQVIDFLRSKRLLLILDDFDRLLDGADLIMEILRQTERVKILATSRERLDLRHERVFRIKGLAVPQDTDDKKFSDCGSVRLFCEIAGRVHSDFCMSDTEKAAILKICRILDGMPLGLELAAGWIRVMPCLDIASQIEQSIDFLATTAQDVPERHRSIRTTFDRSWGMMTGSEKQAFVRLSVFCGGFHRKAAECVAQTSLPVISALIDKSLLLRSNEKRYSLHGLLRQYSRDKLTELQDELRDVQKRHSDYYISFLGDRTKRLRSSEQRRALDEIEIEIANIREAFENAVAFGWIESIHNGLDPLDAFYKNRGWFQVGVQTFGRAVRALRRAAEAEDQPVGSIKQFLAEAQGRLGGFQFRLGKYADAKESLNQSLEGFHEIGAQNQAAFTLENLGHVAWREGKHSEAKKWYSECLQVCREADDQWAEARILDDMGNIALFQSNYEEARRLHEKGLAISRYVDDFWAVASCLNNLGNVADIMGRREKAREYYAESLDINKKIGDQQGISVALTNLGNIASRVGDYIRAKELHLESLTISRDICSDEGIAYSLNVLGDVCLELKEYDAARCYQEESLAITKRAGDKSGSAYSLVSLGDIARGCGDYSTAKSHYKKSIALFRELEERWGLASSHEALGSVLLTMGDVEGSHDLLCEALRTAMEIEAEPLAVDILKEWARLAHKGGKTELSVELLALVLSHPSTEAVTKDEASELLREMMIKLPADRVKAATERGETRPLLNVVEELVS